MRISSALLFATSIVVASPASAAPSDRSAPALYSQLCANCHGNDLQGGKTSSLLDTKWLHARDDAGLAKIIQRGVPKSGMPGFSAALSDAEVRALVIFIREAAHHRKAPDIRPTLELPTTAQSSTHHTFRIEKIVDGLDVPWSLAFLPDGALLYTQRGRGLSIASPPKHGGAWITATITHVPPVWVRDEGGLMAIAVDPNHASNGWLYLTLSDPGESDTGNTKLVRGRIRDGRWADEEPLLAAPRSRYTSLGVNFGGRVVFANGYLFVSFGERGHVGQAQDLSLHNGKVHRILPDGQIPADNPFVNTPGALASIWSYGHRNPQGLAVHPKSGDLWETEHGPRGGDELNYVRRGRNYGWPLATHGMNYDGTPISPLTGKKGLESPVLHWTPSIAVSPIRFYTGDAFPKWKNNLFLGTLAQQELQRLEIKGARVIQQEVILKNCGRVRDMITGPDGYLYVALEVPGPDTPDCIVRLVPANL